MRESYDEKYLEMIEKITCLSGSELYCLTGTVFATVFLGKMPTKESLAAYLNASKRTVSETLRSAVITSIEPRTDFKPLVRWFGRHMDTFGPRPAVGEVVYPLATLLSVRGLYFDGGEEPYDRAIVRGYLSTMFDAQSVQLADEFAGYNIMLEYLWAVVGGADESIDDFIRVRFEPELKAPSKLQSFSALVYQQNSHLKDLHSPDYFLVSEFLADGARRARNYAMRLQLSVESMVARLAAR